ncbi:hypothetical protein XU18_1303 [Perkinsela sp. CCAP 1560/4]|nr:hypothetical protein XU18_1303 [Perkinsela sp. CCAP 1560/4]|eukprot:KNH08137.1 hypothetical protein XU18_1303 [Perkinsela sp. CCAP 1560/4]
MDSARRPVSSFVVQTKTAVCDLQSARKGLESVKVGEKIQAIENILALSQCGYQINSFLMPIIQYCLPEKNHRLRRIIYLYLEEATLQDFEGHTLPETLLLVSSVRNDLLHSNEFIRSIALRFVSKLKLVELVDPLFSAVLECCTHPEAFVRRDAIFTLKNIYSRSPKYFVNIDETLLEILPNFTDPMTKHALLETLNSISPEKIISFVQKEMRQVKREYDRNSFEQSYFYFYIRFLFELLRKSPRELYSTDSILSFSRCFLCESKEYIHLEAAETILSLAPERPDALHLGLQAFFNLTAKSEVDEVKYRSLSLILEYSPKADELNEYLKELIKITFDNSGQLQTLALDILLTALSPKSVEIILASLKRALAEPNSHAILKPLVRFLSSAIPSSPNTIEALMNFILKHLFHLPGQAENTMVLLRCVITSYPEKQTQILSWMFDMLQMDCSEDQIRCLITFIVSALQNASEVKIVAHALEQLTACAAHDTDKLSRNALLLAQIITKAHQTPVNIDQKEELLEHLRKGLKKLEDFAESDQILERNILICRIVLENAPTDLFANAFAKDFSIFPQSSHVQTSFQAENTAEASSLSSVNDIVHVSCGMTRINLSVHMQATLHNRSSDRLYNVSLEFVPARADGGRHWSNSITLDPSTSGTASLRIPLPGTIASSVLAKLHYSTSPNGETKTLGLQSVAIPLRKYLCGSDIFFEDYKLLWSRLEYEDRLKIRDIVDPQVCIDDIQHRIGLRLRLPLTNIADRSQVHAFFHGRTIFGNDILLVLELDRSNTNETWSGKLTVRSNLSPGRVVVDEISALGMYHTKERYTSGQLFL